MSLLQIVAGILGVYLLTSYLTRRSIGVPGPARLPFIGSAHKMPLEKAWLVFSEWQQLYGNLIYMDLLGQPMIVVNSARVARELLAKRSNIYSDRPILTMAKLCGYYETLTLLPYGDEWRQQRRIIAQELSPAMMPAYYKLHESTAALLIRNIIANPDALMPELKLRIGSIIYRITYGYKIESAEDPMLNLALEALDNFSEATTPGKFLVDLVPALQHLPQWFPGAGFLKTRDAWLQKTNAACANPFEWTKAHMEAGDVLRPNLCTRHLEKDNSDLSARNEELKPLIWAAASIMGAALDTKRSLVLTFLRAMILHPEIAAKAQAEIDSVVGKDRLPSIADKGNLPYVRSILAEVMRYGPPLPLGIPHALRQDDVYEGCFLPKGSTIFTNIWHMLNDPKEYENPSVFNPDRFLGRESDIANVYDIVFGFGRRACPGLHLAEGTLFSIIATILATCNILPGRDGEMPSTGYHGGTISFPEHFSIQLVFRSTRAASLVSDVTSEME